MSKYRDLAKKFHPDQFEWTLEEKREAEETLKLITQVKDNIDQINLLHWLFIWWEDNVESFSEDNDISNIIKKLSNFDRFLFWEDSKWVPSFLSNAVGDKWKLYQACCWLDTLIEKKVWSIMLKTVKWEILRPWNDLRRKEYLPELRKIESMFSWVLTYEFDKEWVIEWLWDLIDKISIFQLEATISRDPILLGK
jgi:hypothetical protein